MKAILIFFVLCLVSCKTTLNPKELLLFTYNDVYNWKDCVIPSEDYISKELPKIRFQFFGSFSHVPELRYPHEFRAVKINVKTMVKVTLLVIF